MAGTWECSGFVNSSPGGLHQVGPRTHPGLECPFRTSTHPRLSLGSGILDVSLSSGYSVLLLSSSVKADVDY